MSANNTDRLDLLIFEFLGEIQAGLGRILRFSIKLLCQEADQFGCNQKLKLFMMMLYQIQQMKKKCKKETYLVQGKTTKKTN